MTLVSVGALVYDEAMNPEETETLIMVLDLLDQNLKLKRRVLVLELANAKLQQQKAELEDQIDPILRRLARLELAAAGIAEKASFCSDWTCHCGVCL